MIKISDLNSLRELPYDERKNICEVLISEYNRFEKPVMEHMLDIYYNRNHPSNDLINRSIHLFHDWRRLKNNLQSYITDDNIELTIHTLGYFYPVVNFLEYLSEFYQIK